MQEFDLIEPWARCVAATTRHFLANRHIELRRPPLLQPPPSDFRTFDMNFGNDPMTPFLTVRQCIKTALERGDGFVIDVTQSEVVVNGIVRRIGVLSLVSPHRWRT
jgi:hypothetical protein